VSSIVTAIGVFKTRLEGIAGVTTVLDYVTEQDPPASDLPLICLKVNAPTSTGVMDRRTLIWPVDLYFFGCIRSHNIAADLTFVLPFWEAIVGRLDGDLTLNNTLDGVISYPEPMGGDPGAIAWVKQTYTGFVLHPLLPVITDTAYA